MILTTSPGKHGFRSGEHRHIIRLLAAVLLVITSLLSSLFAHPVASADAETITGQRIAVGATTVWYRPAPPVGSGPNLLEAIDSATGQVQRSFDVEAGALIAGALGDICLLALPNGTLQAYAATATAPLWSYDAIEQPALLGSDDAAFYLSGTSGVSGEPQIVAVALEATSGAERWQASLTEVGIGAASVQFRGLVSQGMVVAVPEGAHAIYGIDATTGSILWKERYDATTKNLSVTGQGVVFFLDNVGSMQDAVRAYDLHTGDALWTLKAEAISEHASGLQGVHGAGDLVLVSYMTPTPILEFNEGMRTGVAAVEASTGAVRWLFPGEDDVLQGDITFASDASGVYVHTNRNVLSRQPAATYGLDPATGEQRWGKESDQTARLEGVAAGMLVFTPEGGRPRIVTLNSENGKSGWELVPSGTIMAPIATVILQEHAMYALGDSLTAIDPLTGNVRWSAGAPVEFTPQPILDVNARGKTAAIAMAAAASVFVILAAYGLSRRSGTAATPKRHGDPISDHHAPQ